MIKLFKKDLRKQYRNQVQAVYPFQFNLVLSSRELLPGTVFNISMNGTAIGFDLQRFPNIALNERVRL